MNSYEAKQQARRERLEAAADRAQASSNSHFQAAYEAVKHIPMGQPIIVGHHSERRHRRDLARHDSAMRRGIEAQDRAAELAHKAAAVGTGGISSDDPEAINKLKEQIEKAEQAQDKMKRANACIRGKDDAGLLALGFTQEQIEKLKTPDFVGRVGFASYALTNNNANIRRMKARLSQLEQQQKRAEAGNDVERSGAGSNGTAYTYREDTAENRVMLLFTGKPSDEIRAEMRRYGFKWSPTRGAWVRKLNNAAIYAAQCVIAKL